MYSPSRASHQWQGWTGSMQFFLMQLRLRASVALTPTDRLNRAYYMLRICVFACFLRFLSAAAIAL